MSANETAADIAYGCDADSNTATCEFEAIVSLASPPLTESQAGVQVFVPLYTEPTTSTSGRVMAGIPTADLSLEIGGSLNGNGFQPSPVQNTATPFFVFVGTGLKRGTADPVILHDQLTPIRQTFEFPWTDANGVQTEAGNPLHYGCGTDAETLCDRGRLVGVTSRILPGDQVGLIFTPSDVQYQQLVNFSAGTLRIRGNVELPIYPPSPLPESNN